MKKIIDDKSLLSYLYGRRVVVVAEEEEEEENRSRV